MGVSPARCSFFKMPQVDSAETDETGFWRFRHIQRVIIYAKSEVKTCHLYRIVDRPPRCVVGTGNSVRKL